MHESLIGDNFINIYIYREIERDEINKREF